MIASAVYPSACPIVMVRIKIFLDLKTIKNRRWKWSRIILG
jgi:hypothetical protein